VRGILVTQDKLIYKVVGSCWNLGKPVARQSGGNEKSCRRLSSGVARHGCWSVSGGSRGLVYYQPTTTEISSPRETSAVTSKLMSSTLLSRLFCHLSIIEVKAKGNFSINQEYRGWRGCRIFSFDILGFIILNPFGSDFFCSAVFALLMMELNTVTLCQWSHTNFVFNNFQPFFLAYG